MWRARQLSFPRSDDEKKLIEAAKELDAIAADIEEFGTITASTPTLLLNPGNTFKFDLSLTANDIFKEKPVQGFSAIRDYEEFSLRVAAAVSLLRTGQVNEANAELVGALLGADAGGLGQDDGAMMPADETTGDDGTGDMPTEGGQAENGTPDPQEPDQSAEGEDDTEEEDDTPEVPGLPAEVPRATPDAFTEALDVPDPDKLDISMRDLIKRVFDDKMTHQVFEWMSAPDPKQLGTNKQLYAAVFTVSLRPGRRSYQGYVGEIDVRPNYFCNGQAYCGGKAGPDTKFPASFAVFPALDSQALDLRSSIRRQRALALLLEAILPAAAGGAVSGAGALSANYLRRLEQDGASRSLENFIVGYNAGGQHFGWRFSPSFTALADAAELGSGPGNILKPQSFPALVMIAADKDNLLPELGGTCNPSSQDKEKAGNRKSEKKGQEKEAKKQNLLNTGTIPENAGGAGGKSAPCFKSIVFSYTTRWLRAPSPSADDSWVPFSGTWNRWRHPRLEEGDVVGWGIRLARAQERIHYLEWKFPPGASLYEAVWNLDKRWELLKAASIGKDLFTDLPKPKDNQPPSPRIAGVAPTHGKPGVDNLFVVTGAGFEPKDKEGKPIAGVTQFFVGGWKDRNPTIVSDTTAILRVPAAQSRKTNHKMDITVVNPLGKSATLKSAVQFDLEPAKAPTTPPKPKAVVILDWDKDAGGQPRLKRLETKGAVEAKDVLNAITRPTNASSANSADVDITVDVNKKP